MQGNESTLLFRALCYEQGHERRTQHILKVYALAKLLGEAEGLDEEQRQLLQAAAIFKLHSHPACLLLFAVFPVFRLWHGRHLRFLLLFQKPF